MPAPRLLPDNDVLIMLRNKGLPYDEIAAMYGVTRGAVYLRLQQAHAVKPRARHTDTLPWRVAMRHQHATPAKLLRDLGRLREGKPVPIHRRRRVQNWTQDLKARGLVVCYRPDFGPNPASPRTGGFHYTRRRPGDHEYIRLECDHDLPPKK